jgi:hypothetical protein
VQVWREVLEVLLLRQSACMDMDLLLIFLSLMGLSEMSHGLDSTRRIEEGGMSG